MKFLSTHLTIVGTCLVAISISACGGKQEAPPAAPAPIASASNASVSSNAPVSAPTSNLVTVPSTEAAPALEPPRRHKGQHPLVEMIFAELPQVGLSSTQKTAVESIETELKKQTEGIDAPKKQFDTDVADGAAAGKLDKSKVDADVKKLAQAAESTAAAVQEAMNQLHKTLDRSQRKKLVEILRAEADKHHGRDMGVKGEKHPSQEKDGKAERSPERRVRAGQEPGDKLAAELGLSAEQRDKLSKKLEIELKAEKANMKANWATMQKHMKNLLDAFESDTFDAKKAGVGGNIREMVTLIATGRIRFVEAVLSVLTPEQRGKFAEHVRQRVEERDDD